MKKPWTKTCKLNTIFNRQPSTGTVPEMYSSADGNVYR